MNRNTLLNNQKFLDWTEEESCVLLDKTDCAMCGCCMFDPKALVACTVSMKDLRSHSRSYFPFYHFVCESCFEILDDEDQLERLDLQAFAVPSWSLIKTYVAMRKYRPMGIVAISDMDAVMDLVGYIWENTTNWEDFNCLSFGAYEDILSI